MTEQRLQITFFISEIVSTPLFSLHNVKSILLMQLSTTFPPSDNKAQPSKKYAIPPTLPFRTQRSKCTVFAAFFQHDFIKSWKVLLNCREHAGLTSVTTEPLELFTCGGFVIVTAEPYFQIMGANQRCHLLDCFYATSLKDQLLVSETFR